MLFMTSKNKTQHKNIKNKKLFIKIKVINVLIYKK